MCLIAGMAQADRFKNSHPKKPARSLPPAFTPVKLRGRQDGWNPQVQCVFLAQLFLTGSVAMAAKRVGRSRASAYKLRRRHGAESFAAAWDHVITGPATPGEAPIGGQKVRDWRKLTLKDLFWRHKTGLWRPVIYRGKVRGIAHKPDNSALLRLLRRLDTKAPAHSEGRL